MFCNKLECFSLSVTSTLVYHLQAKLEPYMLNLLDSTLRVGSWPYPKVEKLAWNKYFSLLGPFMSYEEHTV